MNTFVPEAAPSEVTSDQHHWGSSAQDNEWHSEDVPSQIHMDETPLQSVTDEAQMKGKGGKGTTLRSRRQRCSVEELQEQVDCLQEGVAGEQITDTDVNIAEARGMADNVLKQLQAGGVARQSTLGNFERLAFTDTTTSRAAQIVLQEASVADAAALSKALRGCVRNAVQSKHANYVIQQIVEIMPVSHASFIVDELKGVGHEVARHRFGCRVLCRILEHLTLQNGTLDLVEEILVDVQELCCHEYGSFVVRHLLEFGIPHHRHCVASALCSDLHQLCKHKLGSHVVEYAFRHCATEDKYTLASQITSNQQKLLSVAANQYGRHVVRALLGMPDDLKKPMVEALTPLEQKLKTLRYGKSVLAALRTASVP
jgi:hypothetical protein